MASMAAGIGEADACSVRSVEGNLSCAERAFKVFITMTSQTDYDLPFDVSTVTLQICQRLAFWRWHRSTKPRLGQSILVSFAECRLSHQDTRSYRSETRRRSQ